MRIRQKIVYIDELDEYDNVNISLRTSKKTMISNLLSLKSNGGRTEIVSTTIFLPLDERTAEFAAIKCGEKLGLEDVTVVHKQGLHPSEGTIVEIKGKVKFDIDIDELVISGKGSCIVEEEIRADISAKPMFVVAATVGNDEALCRNERNLGY